LDTLAQARAILTNYEKVNNQANSHLSDKLISSIETGPMLKGDLIDYKITRAGDDPKIKPFTYRSPHFSIPTNAGTGWFAVDATSSNGGGAERTSSPPPSGRERDGSRPSRSTRTARPQR
jgi:hypothetical protein